MEIKIIGSRPKKPGFVSKMIMWYENKTNRWDFWKYVIRGKFDKKDISHIAILIDQTVYEAVGKGFLPMPFSEWKEKNLVIWKCDPFETLNIPEAFKDRANERCKALVKADTSYGFFTLGGIIINDKTGLTWFADGKKTTICSESPMYVFEEHLPPRTKPADYYTPKDIIAIFKMVFVGMYT